MLPNLSYKVRNCRFGIIVSILTLILVVGTISVFWPAINCGFINFDDDGYVTSNPHVQNGLAWSDVEWAFRAVVNSMWHPITLISYMADDQVYGLNAWGFHLTNVLLHATNAALVFILFLQLSDAIWRSFVAAALFAFHPLRVESVVWIAERKDVLSGFFGLFSLVFYGIYAKATRPDRHGVIASSKRISMSYTASLFLYFLGLLSKPMLVTLPFLMLLVDYWPLGRLAGTEGREKVARFGTLVWEKTLFFAVAALASIAAYLTQEKTGAIASVLRLPIDERVSNVLLSYFKYLGKMFWPVRLAIFYPYPGDQSMSWSLLALISLLGITVLSLRKAHRYPFFAMGWLWFLGTLIPVIGIVQVGGQDIADRYTYLPMLGILVIIVWGAFSLAGNSHNVLYFLDLAAGAAIVACATMTHKQIAYWNNSESLFSHALAVAPDNYLSRTNFGAALAVEGRMDEAIQQFQIAVRLNPSEAMCYVYLGRAFAFKNDFKNAAIELGEAIRLRPNLAIAHLEMGDLLIRQKENDRAAVEYRIALQSNPDLYDAHLNLGKILNGEGHPEEALAEFQAASTVDPRAAMPIYSIALILADRGNDNEAINELTNALRLRPEIPEFHNALGLLLVREKQIDAAVDQFREAIQLNPNYVDAYLDLGSSLADRGQIREALQTFEKAVSLDPNDANAKANLARAFRMLGK